MSPTARKTAPAVDDTPTDAPTPSPLVATAYAAWTGPQLAGPGPDLPDETALGSQVAEPPRNRWGLVPAPVDALPAEIVRALWRWDRAVDLAADIETRAREHATDHTLDEAARAADTAAILAGTPAHALADLEHERRALALAAVEVRAAANRVAELAHEVVALSGEGDPEHYPGIPALNDHLRATVGADLADYLATLARLTRQRATIVAKVERVANWWASAARPDYPNRRIIVAPTVTLDAAAVAVRFDGVRNPTDLDVSLDALAAADTAALAPYATR